MHTQVFAPDDTKMEHPMDSFELARFANSLYPKRKGPFTQFDFNPGSTIPGNPDYRLAGMMCDCGYDEKAPGRPSLGKFKLLPINSPEDQDGLKCYMRCVKCGAYSHL
jgi:hypothetical protein